MSSILPKLPGYANFGGWHLCPAPQTVIVSVLESLRQHLSTFTLSSVIEEIRHWSETGRSCFARWAEKLWLIGNGLRDEGRPSLLDRVIPVPDG